MHGMKNRCHVVWCDAFILFLIDFIVLNFIFYACHFNGTNLMLKIYILLKTKLFNVNALFYFYF